MDLFNKKTYLLKLCLPGIMCIFFNVDFCMPIFLQYLLISWFLLFLSNSFNIPRLFTKCHLLKFTFKDFTGLSLLQISVQIRNSMQIFGGSNSTFWTHQAKNYLSQFVYGLFCSYLSNMGVTLTHLIHISLTFVPIIIIVY